ncbi:MAG: GNAT family N-acetyltransferase [Anaerolineaceae bacterium]
MLPMEFTPITTEQDWDALSQEWDQLFNKSFMQVPFLSFAYLRAWWQTLGGAEWQPETSRLQIITARDNGSLIGIAPLFQSSKPGFEPALRFIGSVEVSDYLDFLAEPERLPEFLSGLLSFVQNDPTILNKTLDLYNLLDDSISLPALQAASEAAGWSFQSDRLQPSPYILLAPTWEEYLAGLSKKQRHEIRRKLRNAEARHETDWYVVQDQDQLRPDMDAFIAMMRQDPNKEAFLNDAMYQHLQATAQLAFDQHRLQLSFLTMDGHKTASYLSLISQNKIWVYNSAWESAYAPCSPGWVLLAKVIQWGIGQGFREVDMMRGDEGYKYKFGAVDRFVMHAICEPK